MAVGTSPNPEGQPEGSPPAWKTPHTRGDIDFETVPEMWSKLSQRVGDLPAVIDDHHEPKCELTFAQLHDEIVTLAWGMRDLGVKPRDMVAVFSENGARWLCADQAAMLLGAANAVRGVTSPPEELLFILKNSGAKALVCQDLKTLEAVWPLARQDEEVRRNLRLAVVLWGGVRGATAEGLVTMEHGPTSPQQEGALVPLYSYEEVIEVGRSSQDDALAADADADLASSVTFPSSAEDVATLVYTSGTTGSPKGAALTHGNFMYQVGHLHNVINVPAGTNTLSLLPPWHIYQRGTMYFSMSCGICFRMSNVNKFASDLASHGTDFLIAVPLVLENLYKKVTSQFKKFPPIKRALVALFLKASTAYVAARRVVQGVSLAHALSPPRTAQLARAALTCLALRPLHLLGNALVYSKVREAVNIVGTIISGGGALARHLEDFYEIIGIELLNGWGLTETSPVLAARAQQHVGPDANVRGTIGKPLPCIELKVVDPQTMRPVPQGEQGLILAKGPTVFKEYYNNAEATSKAFRHGPGWYDTGDLGYVVPHSDRHSMGGMYVLVGREKETIVLTNGENVEPAPIEDACLASPLIQQIVVVGQDEKFLAALVVPDVEVLAERRKCAPEALSSDQVEQAVSKVVKRAGSKFRPFEQVRRIHVVREPMTFENGLLTRTMKIKRHVVAQRFAGEIDAMFGR